jgi:predicted RNA binding protein YcfA (HicA-like mRNA interferase family)
LTFDTKYSTIQKEGQGKLPGIEKIINKMKRQPNGIRQEEADKVLKAYGYELVRQKGSHRHYLNKETGELITIKQENPLKKAYVVSILNRIGK